MPNIIIPKGIIMQVKNKTGIYSQTKKPVIIKDRMTDAIVNVIERAFREYCKAHTGCTLEMENKEWRRFLSKLQKHL